MHAAAHRPHVHGHQLSSLLLHVFSHAGDVSADEDDEELLGVGPKTWSNQGDLLTADDE